MSLGSFRKVLKHYGLIAAVQDIAISIVNKLVHFRVLMVYVKDTASGLTYPTDIDIHSMSPEELATLQDKPGLELPSSFLQAAAANNDICFGAYINGELAAYAWYATSPPTFADGSTAHFDPSYAYAYKNLTLSSSRGRGLQKFIKEYAFTHFRALGKSGLMIAIDSLNHASYSSTANSGARLLGYWAYIKRANRLTGFPLGISNSLFEMTMASPPATDDIQIEVVRNLETLLDPEHAYADWAIQLPSGKGLTYSTPWVSDIGPVYLAQNKRPFFLLAWKNQQLIGVAPFLIEKKPLSAFGLRRLYFWGGIQGTLNNMMGDILVRHVEDEKRCIHAFIKYLSSQARSEWDMLDLAYLSEDSPCRQIFAAALPNTTSTPESMESFQIELPASFDEYCREFPRKPLSDIKRCGRKLQESGATFEITSVTELSNELLTDLAKLHSARQDEHRSHGATRHSLFQREAENIAFRRLLNSAPQKGIARHYLLTIDGHIASFFIGFVTGKVYHLFLTAFDSKYSEYGPTKLLLLDVCQQEIEKHGTKRINLSTGESRYKREFANRIDKNFHLSGVNTAPASRLRNAGYLSLRTLKQTLKR